MNRFNNYFKNKKILVTGHTGFKGAWLCMMLNYLEAKIYGVSVNYKKGSLFEKTELKKKIIKNYFIDIRDKKKLNNVIKKVNPEIIIHFAAQSLVINGYKDPIQTFETNINGTINVIHSFMKLKCAKKILITTTDKVYEDRLGKPYKEENRLWGSDPYSASKVSAEQVIDSYRLLNKAKLQKKIILVARSGNVIGGGDISKNRIIPDIINAIKRKSVLNVRSPNSVRPWQHVLDPIYGYLKLLYKRDNNLKNDKDNWNFGPNKKDFKKVIDLVKFFEKRFNLKYKIIKNKYKETKVLMLDSQKSFIKLKWRGKLNFFDTMSYIVDYEDNLKKKINPFYICNAQIENYFKKVKN